MRPSLANTDVNVLSPQYEITTKKQKVHVYSVGKELKLSITTGLLPQEPNRTMYSVSKIKY